jgi:hypothetical protein
MARFASIRQILQNENLTCQQCQPTQARALEFIKVPWSALTDANPGYLIERRKRVPADTL